MKGTQSAGELKWIIKHHQWAEKEDRREGKWSKRTRQKEN
jgi:hypothetical protein